MGIIRLTLVAAGLIWLAMYYFGRDEGLPADRIGRAPDPAPAVALADELATDPEPVAEAPAPTEPVAAEPAPSIPTPAPTPTESLGDLAAAVSEATGMDDAEQPGDPEAPPPAAAPEATPDAPAPEAAPTPEPEPAPASQPEPEPELVLYVTGRRVNVRSGPSTAFTAITSLARGAAVIDLGPVGADGWHEIQLDTGELGYMSGDFLSPEPQ